MVEAQEDIGGWELEYRIVHWVIPVFTIMLRLAMGWIFLYAGLDKLAGGFSAEEFLLNDTSGPFKDLFVDLGKSSAAVAVIDVLVVWGQILIGACLILGLFTRLALFLGGMQMFLFWLAQLWPEYNPFLDEHIIYIIVMALLGALGAGRILGLDALLERQPFVQRIPRAEYLLG